MTVPAINHRPAVKLRHATCPYCGVGCRITAKIQDNRIVDVYAEKHAAPNFGMLCQKGAMLKSDAIWDERARLTQPMLRPSRDQPLRPVSWDHAISFIVDRLVSTQRKHGRDAVAFYGSGQLDTEACYMFTKLFKGALRTNNQDSNSRLCMSSAVAGYVQTFGSDGPPTCYEDIFHADVFLIAGANMAVNHPVLFNMVRRQRARRGDSRVIVLDPRRTATAEAADVHVPLAPGSDVALLQLVAQRLLRRGSLDQRFIADHTEGFETYRRHIESLDEQRLLDRCGIGVSLLDRVVDIIDGQRLLSFYCQGLNQSVAGVDKNTALVNLHMQLGQVGKFGCGPFSLTGQPNAMGGRESGYLAHQLPGYRFVTDAEHRREVEALWRMPSGTIGPAPGLDAVRMFEAVGRGDVKLIWIACTNPVVSMPDANAVTAALERAELVIHQDCYHPTETGMYADVLLPAAQWGEKTGTMTNSERRVQRSQKLFDAPGEAMPDWWIAARVGHAIGHDGFDFTTAEQVWDEYRRLTAGRPCDQMGMTNRRLAAGSLRWPCTDESNAGTDRRYVGGVFDTPSGRARFLAPKYRDPAETADDAYPLALTTGRIASQWHTRTRTGRVAELNAQDPEPFVEVHPDDAQMLGLDKCEWVSVVSRRGSALARLRITKMIRAGTAFTTFHWGESYAPGVNANDVTNPAADPVSRQPELKFAAVRIVPASAPRPRVFIHASGEAEP